MLNYDLSILDQSDFHHDLIHRTFFVLILLLRVIAYDLIPKVKLEVVIPDSQLDSVVKAITESARTEEGEHGDGVIFIYTIDEVVNIGSSEYPQES
jgi:nitrogen regulatory protein PII